MRQSVAVANPLLYRRNRAKIEQIEVPHEFVEILAYEKFELGGRTDGRDQEDWFAAERELNELFGSIHWHVAESIASACITIRANGSLKAIQVLDRYLQKCPSSTTSANHRIACLRVVWPEGVTVEKLMQTSKIEISTSATPEQLVRARAASSPVIRLAEEQFAQLKGQLVALLLEGPEKGKVIAFSPLDHEHPEVSRRKIKAMIADTPFKSCRYQLRQVLEGSVGD